MYPGFFFLERPTLKSVFPGHIYLAVFRLLKHEIDVEELSKVVLIVRRR